MATFIVLLLALAPSPPAAIASPADIATRERTIARLARVAYDAFSSPTPAPR